VSVFFLVKQLLPNDSIISQIQTGLSLSADISSPDQFDTLSDPQDLFQKITNEITNVLTQHINHKLEWFLQVFENQYVPNNLCLEEIEIAFSIKNYYIGKNPSKKTKLFKISTQSGVCTDLKLKKDKEKVEYIFTDKDKFEIEMVTFLLKMKGK